MLMRAGTTQSRVVAVLEEGPATCREISIETGIPKKTCAAYLCNLEKAGVVCVAGKMPNNRCPECGHTHAGRRESIYQLVAGQG